MTAPKSRYATDPFLLALSGAPRQLLLTRNQAAGFLGLGLTTLDEWRSRGLPPPYVDLRGMVRYKAGDLMDFVDGLPTSQLNPAPKTAGASVPVLGLPTAPVPADKLQRLGMYAPIMRGGRRRKVATDALATPIRSLDTWLTHAASNCPWRFLLMPIEVGSPGCPIDLLATLDLDDIPEYAEWAPLTLSEYAEQLRRHVKHIEAVELARERERELAALPQSDTPYIRNTL